MVFQFNAHLTPDKNRIQIGILQAITNRYCAMLIIARQGKFIYFVFTTIQILRLCFEFSTREWASERVNEHNERKRIYVNDKRLHALRIRNNVELEHTILSQCLKRRGHLWIGATKDTKIGWGRLFYFFFSYVSYLISSLSFILKIGIFFYCVFEMP